MKKLKKAFSLVLALTLCTGLAVPAFAEEENGAPMPNEEGLAPVSVDLGEYTTIEQEITLYDYLWYMGYLSEEQISDFDAVKSDNKITVSHIGDDPATFIYVYFEKYTKSAETKMIKYFVDIEDISDAEWITEDFKGKYLDETSGLYTYLSNSKGSPDYAEFLAESNGKYWNKTLGGDVIWYDDDIQDYVVDQNIDPIQLRPGESVTFTLPNDGSDSIYRLYARISYPQYAWSYWWRYDIKVDDELAASAPAEPEQPTTPSTPTTPGTPIPDVVMLSRQNLEVDGKTVECEKYNIDGSNYFKLRDLAQVLNGTGSQFEVGYDAAASTVTITTGAAYTSAGTELATGVDNSATTQPSAQSILIDGVAHGELTVYNIGGSNFFQLRELGQLLGFEVGYDVDTNTTTVRSAQK